MKTCSKCQQKQSFSEFAVRGTLADGSPRYQSWCRRCNREYQKSHYLDNRDSYISKSKTRKGKIKDQIRTLKEASPCTDCGQYYPYFVMHFDHLGDEPKDFNIAHGVVHKGFGLETILREIEKCELVCANCHAFRSHSRRNE